MTSSKKGSRLARDIRASLPEALAFASGKPTKAIVHRVKKPPQLAGNKTIPNTITKIERHPS